MMEGRKMVLGSNSNYEVFKMLLLVMSSVVLNRQ